MPWASATLRDNFQTIMESIKAFRKKLDEQPKYDPFFKNIETAGLEIARILHADHLPETADQFISSASGGIKTALKAISGSKEGLQEGANFRDKIFEIYEFVVAFSINGGSEATQKEKLKKEQKKQKEEKQNSEKLIEIEESDKKDNLKEESNLVVDDKKAQVEHQIKLYEESTVEQRLLSYDALCEVIKSIGLPSKELSNWSKAKHTVNHAFFHYPKTMISGVSEMSFGVGFMALFKLSQEYGEVANQWLSSTLGINVQVEYAVPFAITLLGSVQAFIALMKSRPQSNQSTNVEPTPIASSSRFHKPKAQNNTVELDGIVIDEKKEEKESLLRGMGNSQ